MQSSSSSGAIRWGVIFGVILAVIGILSSVILRVAFGSVLSSGTTQQIASEAGGILALTCVGLLIELALVFVAGIFAARASGSVGQGAIGGLIAGIVGTLISGIVGLVINAISPLTVSSAASSSTVSTSAASSVVGLVIGLILWAGLGAGLGALGGLIGKAQYRGPVQAYQSSMYQGMGQPPQGYPPQPGYPQQPQGFPPPPQYPQQPQDPGAYPPPPPQYPQQQ